jgi:hypothetical protein
MSVRNATKLERELRVRVATLESSLKEAEQERDRRGRLLADALVEIERLTELQTVADRPEERDIRDAVLHKAAIHAICGPQTIDVEHKWSEDWLAGCAGKVGYANRKGENDMAQHIFKLIAAEMSPEGRAKYMPHAGLPDTPTGPDMNSVPCK